MKRQTFRGDRHRVQLAILDRCDPVVFLVYALPAGSHPATAFRVVGSQVYYGENADEAWDAVKELCPDATWPSSWGEFRRSGKPLIEIL